MVRVRLAGAAGQQPNPPESAGVTRQGKEGDDFGDREQKERRWQSISVIVTTGGF